MKVEEAGRRLVDAIRSLPARKQPSPGAIPTDWQPPEDEDWLWSNLLLSFSTMGNAQGAKGLMDDPTNRSRVRYDLLASMALEDRATHLERVLRQAKVRWPARKAEMIARDVDVLRDLGGPAEAGKRALKEPRREARLAFLKQFVGIGSKYAHNIWKDIGHPEHQDSIALDSRIKGITRKLGLTFKTYDEEMAFYQGVAAELGVTGNALDYALFESHKEIVGFLGSSEGQIAP